MSFTLDSELHDTLSFPEERHWYLEQLEPGNRAYIMTAAARISGLLDTSAFSKTIETIFKRHEILRTTYHNNSGRPERRIWDHPGHIVNTQDLAALNQFERENEIRRILHEESNKPFDLTTLPLFRVRLLRLADDEWVNVSSVHHIIFDWWSAQVFHREFLALYEAFRENREAPLPKPPIQYSAFARQQRRTHHSEHSRPHLLYWRNQLQNPPTLTLQTDRPRRASQSYAAAIERVNYPKELGKRLTAIGARCRATLFMTTLAGFAIMLHALSEQTDLLIGIDIANRIDGDTEALLGCFINELPIRLDLSRNLTFLELVAHVAEKSHEAYEHEDFPFHQMLHLLQRPREAQSAPLFRAKQSFVSARMHQVTHSGLTVSPIEMEPSGTELDLTLILENLPSSLLASMYYRSELFYPSTISKLLRQIQALFQEVINRPDMTIRELRKYFERNPAAVGRNRSALTKSYENIN